DRVSDRDAEGVEAVWRQALTLAALAVREVAPLELLAHPGEEPLGAEADEVHRPVGALHDQALALLDGGAGLPVERDEHLFGPGRDRLDGDLGRGRHDEGSDPKS